MTSTLPTQEASPPETPPAGTGTGHAGAGIPGGNNALVKLFVVIPFRRWSPPCRWRGAGG